jgi:nascent polypeptide-associated complex subunit alpha
MMDRMGLKIEEFGDCTEVVFRMASGKELVIQSPQVTRMKTGGQDVFQVAGRLEERAPESHEEGPGMSQEDVQLVAEQVGVSLDEARAALVESKGDLAQAILNLKLQKK